MAVYYNIIFSFIFFLFQMSVHIQKRYTYRYSETMRIIVPILIAGFGLCEGLRLYLGFSGNLMERIPSLSAFLLLTFFPVAPVVIYLSFFQRQQLPIEVAAGIPFVAMLVVEVVAGYTTVRRLIKKQTAQFYAMCQQDAKQQ